MFAVGILRFKCASYEICLLSYIDSYCAIKCWSDFRGNLREPKQALKLTLTFSILL